MAVSAVELANLDGMIPRGTKRAVPPMTATRISDSLAVAKRGGRN
jgi:hypothetical protein